MADSESDVETDGLESALDSLYKRHCSDHSSLNSKSYCSEFCELVEEYTGQWQVPLPQLKVLWTALCSFTKATAAFPDDCQHIHYVLSSMALSFFELMLFFSKEEFGEKPLKDILDSFQECHSRLLRHRNIYLQHVKQIIKAGGPWENPVLQGILKEAHMSPKEVEDYLSSEPPVLLELRVRYLQACERLQEAKVLAKSCLENHEAGKHLFFHQAYLTCLYKASLHEHLHKEMAEIDGRDAVEIICNTESVEKDELLLSLCKAFLKQQLHNGDMYYIWDLVFIWSRLHLRAHPSRPAFLAECLQLASSATNIRAIFPFIKLVTAELGHDGVHVCVELCARALQLCDLQSDSVTRSLVCKTIAFLLPHDLEICRACALLVFCQERSLDAYRTVCLLYMHPDQEPHPHNSPVRTSVRFHILQMLKERLCFDPEFWNLLTLRTYCLELMSDKVVKAAVLSEIKEEEEKGYSDEPSVNNCINESCVHGFTSCRCSEAASVNRVEVKEETVNGQKENGVAPVNNVHLRRRKWKRRSKEMPSDDEADVSDDPEIKYNVKTSRLDNKPVYSLRRNHTKTDNSAAAKLPVKRNREYLSRCVKSQIFKRKGRKKRWLQGLPRAEPVQPVKERKVKGKKRGRKPLQKLELSYPDNEMCLTEEEAGVEEMADTERSEGKENQLEQVNDIERDTEGLEKPEAPTSEDPPSESQAAAPSVEGAAELDGPPLDLSECPVELLHSYCLKPRRPGDEDSELLEPSASNELDDADEELRSNSEVMAKRTWKDRFLRTQQYAHVMFHCKFCKKDYKGLNVLRHALSHLKRRKQRCVLCGKRFTQSQFAKKHIIEHIDEMCKQKPAPKEPQAADKPAANGVVDHADGRDQPQDESQTEEAPEQKPAKPKWSSLKREDRIIRNLRTLIKKTSVLHKKCKNPDANIFKQLDFKDEQVVIQDGLVIVREPYVIEEEGGGGGGGGEGETKEQERPAGENGFGVEVTYHLCPSESCDRVFLRSSSTITRHALKCHSDDEKVLEKTFIWAKNKCIICHRQIQFLQQYKDHMKLHDTALQYFCYHLDCKQRFLTHQELKNHIASHKPLRAQCPFTNCDKLFPSLHGLYDHEWRHYVPTPQKDELELGPSRQKTESAEAPWKQRVKVEETWLQSKKGPRESPALDPAEASRLEENEKPSRADSDSEVGQDAGVNGYSNEAEEGKGSTARRCSSPPAKKMLDPLDVRNVQDLSTLSEGIQQKLGEPHITEHKTFKPEDPSYATFVKAPFIRPPPSTYMDESLLSMRKRRSAEEPSPRKNPYWSYRKKADPAPDRQQEASPEPPEQKTRVRCDKCLSSFGSVDELQKHKALNTCSALFGFDSDDES